MKKHILFLCICIAMAAGLFADALNEGFEGTWPPTDWTIIQGPNSPTNDITQNSDQANSGTYSLRFSSYSSASGYDEYIVTPQLVTTSGDQTVSFWYRKYSYDSEVFKVGWSSTGTDVSTDFTWSDEVTNASTTWQQFVKADLPVGTKYVAIHYYSNYEYYLYIDDVSGPAVFVPEFPAPTALVATDITQTTVNLGWTENGTATSWNIEWGEAGFTLGEGTSIPGVTANPYNLSGLTGGTNYEFYVQTTDPSEWSAVGSFTTMPPAQSFPLTEDFEGGFVKFGNATGNDVDWVLDTTIYHGGVQSVGNPYGVNNENILHETGILDLSSTTAPILKFWQIAKTEGGWDKCYVEISTDGGATYAALPAAAYQGSGSGYATAGYFDEDDYSTWGTSTEIPDNTWWKEETFNLSSYNVADVRLRFRLTSDGSGQRAGWYLDDIEIKEQPTNPVFSIDPTSKDFGTVSINTTSNAQTFTITNTGGGTLTIVEDGISIVGANADQFTLTDENVYPINLAAFGTATVDIAFAPTSAGAKTATLQIVDNITEATNTAALSGTGFDPYIYSFSYNQNFDAVTAPDMPSGWSVLNDTGNSFVKIVTSTVNANSALNSCYFYNSYLTSGNLILISPPTTLSVTGTRVNFMAVEPSSSDTSSLIVGTMTNPTDPATFSAIQTVSLTTTLTQYSVNVTSTERSRETTYIAIKHDMSDSYSDIYIDDFTWEEIPTSPVFAVSPASNDFGTENINETSDAQTFTISNIGAGTLTINSVGITGDNADQFSLTDANSYAIGLGTGESITVDVAFTPTSTGMKTANLHIVDALTETAHDVVLTGEGYDANSGGGAAAQGNYFFANSLASGAPSAPVYNWIDFAGHTPINTWTYGSSDDGYFQVPDIGFDFTFFGNMYRTADVYIGSNGLITFGAGYSSTGTTVSIPVAGSPDNFIAGCLMDLEDDAGATNGAVYYGGDASKFVVTWYHYYDYGDSSEWMTFQIILYPNGNIKIQYNDAESIIDAASTSSTVNGDALIGIENAAGDAGIEYRNNGVGGPIFGSDLALMFGQDEGALPVTLTSFTATVAQETTANIQWTVESESGLVGYYVYRSDSDLLHASAISELIGADNTPFSHSYSFIDNELEYEHTYNYWLESVSSDGTTYQWGPQQVVLEGAPAPQLPEVTELGANYPNPFNPVTVLKLNVKENEEGRLEIFNAKGQVVLKKNFAPGYHEYQWDAEGNASGLYFYRLSSPSYKAVKKMMLLK